MGARRCWTEDDLIDAVRTCRSMAAVIRTLNLRVAGGPYSNLNFHVKRLSLDTSHFTGKGWARGLTRVTAHPMPLAEALVARSPYQNVARLRERLIKAGLKEAACEECGLIEWRGRPLPLALDHINGDRTDNRLENLRVLCPNCHAQTDTWCKRKPKPT